MTKQFVHYDDGLVIELRAKWPVVWVVWDDQNIDYHFKSRTQSPDWSSVARPPAVNRYYPEMREKSGDYRVNLSYPYDWKQAIINLNGGGWTGLRRWEFLTGKARATYNSNTSTSSGWPNQMYVLFSGNVLRGKFVGEWFEFETLRQDDVDRVAGMTKKTHPHLVHSFSCIGWDWRTKSTVHIPSTGTFWNQVYHFVVTKEGIGYIPKRHVVVAEE